MFLIHSCFFMIDEVQAFQASLTSDLPSFPLAPIVNRLSTTNCRVTMMTAVPKQGMINGALITRITVRSAPRFSFDVYLNYFWHDQLSLQARGEPKRLPHISLNPVILSGKIFAVPALLNTLDTIIFHGHATFKNRR